MGTALVGAIGLGAMPLSTKDDRPSASEAEAVVHAALDAGVTLIDTADAYARDEAEFGHNEELVARVLEAEWYGGAPPPTATQVAQAVAVLDALATEPLVALAP